MEKLSYQMPDNWSIFAGLHFLQHCLNSQAIPFIFCRQYAFKLAAAVIQEGTNSASIKAHLQAESPIFAVIYRLFSTAEISILQLRRYQCSLLI